MTKKEYKIITDNLGEYSVLRPDGSIVSTEIQNKARAELFCDELNELLKEIEQLKSICQDHRDHAHDFKADCVRLEKENGELKELLELISRAHSFTKEESVKEILRHEIKAIDTVSGDSAMAWNDYCLLSKFFRKQYAEHWDNE